MTCPIWKNVWISYLEGLSQDLDTWFIGPWSTKFPKDRAVHLPNGVITRPCKWPYTSGNWGLVRLLLRGAIYITRFTTTVVGTHLVDEACNMFFRGFRNLHSSNIPKTQSSDFFLNISVTLKKANILTWNLKNGALDQIRFLFMCFFFQVPFAVRFRGEFTETSVPPFWSYDLIRQEWPKKLRFSWV